MPPLLLALMLAAAPAASPTLLAPGVVSVPVSVTGPTFSPDGAYMVYERGTDTRRELTTARLVDGKWTAGAAIPLDPRYLAIEPAMSTDGAFLLFATNRPASGDKPLDGRWSDADQPGRGGGIWRMERAGDGWGEPKRLSSAINRTEPRPSNPI